MFNFPASSPLSLYLPLYQEFTRILIWPAKESEEFSTYEVWSTSPNIPANYRETEVMKLGVPYLQNHNYTAISIPASETVIHNNEGVPVPVPDGESIISWVIYSSKPDLSSYKASVKVLSLKIQDSLYPQLSFGTVDEVKKESLVSIPLTVIEHPYSLQTITTPQISFGTLDEIDDENVLKKLHGPELTSLVLKSSETSRPKPVAQSRRPKLRGGAKLLPMFAKTEDLELQKLITLMRSLGVWKQSSQPSKCSLSTKNVRLSLCHFCLTRSYLVRVNKRGRGGLIPTEMNCFLDPENDLKSLLFSFLTKLSGRRCLGAAEKSFDPEKCLFDLKNRNLNETLLRCVESLEDDILKEHKLELSSLSQILVLKSDKGVKLRLSEPIRFFDKTFKVKSVITKTGLIFSSNEDWFEVARETILKYQPPEWISDVLFVSLEDKNALDVFEVSELDVSDLIYKPAEQKRIRNLGDRHLDQKDRHLSTPKRREDRHLDQKDRHLDQRDRHLDQRDRHLPTPERREDRHLNKSYRGGSKSFLSAKNSLDNDTGMDVKCCSCLELKSRGSCSLAETLPKELFDNFCVQSETSRSFDGLFYVCITCKKSINSNLQPRRAQKEMIGFLDFPDGFKQMLADRIVPKSSFNEALKPSTELNRLEHHLLKLVIPFLRIGHCNVGRYLNLRGELIMISADIVSSLQKILPVEQNFFPVSFKRKLEYEGYYIMEIVDKEKVMTYFDFLKKYNHLFEDYKLDEDALDKFNSMKIPDLKTESDAVSAEDEPVLENEEEAEKIPMGQSSIIQDKYKESTEAPTVVNQMASTILDLEKYFVVTEEEHDDIDDVDPEQAYFEEDDVPNPQPESPFLASLNSVDILPEDEDNLKNIESLQNIFHNFKTIAILRGTEHYCVLVKKIAFLTDILAQLNKLESNITKLQELIDELSSSVTETIQEARGELEESSKCHHSHANECQKLLELITSYNGHLDDSNISKENHSFVTENVKKIKKKIEEISVAPGEGGQFRNWGEDVFLEEKLFPQLFPYGIGGFLSSNILQNSNMGFANYCKNRLMSVNPKFRRDPAYIFFLLAVKEAIEMKRSEQTYFRKAAKCPNLSAQVLSKLTPEVLQRYNTAFTTFKNVRGTAFYYQDVKKRLMAFLRQKGGPTLFTTFSAAEFDWDHLALKIWETVTNKPSSLEFIKSQSNSWRNKLIQENVVQSTVHFSKRMDKIINFLNTTPLLEFDGVKYKVDSYFYRTEFQARGAPHLHCLLWLRGEAGEEPPCLWMDSEMNSVDIGRKISSFSTDLIAGSSSDAHCPSHPSLDLSCDSCQIMKLKVEKYQTHRHTHTCYKKKKIIKIAGDEGHGRYDGERNGEALSVGSCRFSFPKNPLDKPEYIFSFPEDTDKKIVLEAKRDYAKIRKYLLRLTHFKDFSLTEQWNSFIQMSFFDFLYEVGMFESADQREDPEAQLKARERYLTALRSEVKSSGLLVLRRETKDVFTNNYNLKLMNLHEANIDIQIISDEYAVAEYVSDYCTKIESGNTALLKNINDAAVAEGEPAKITMSKLSKALDKGREVGIQESIYRLLGLPMSKFSEVVKFINSAHPHRRDGLLKQNLDSLQEGESVFHNSIHDYYENRPYNSSKDNTNWEDMSLAEFVSEYNVVRKKTEIELLNKKGFLVKRRKDCVIRYFLRYENDEEYHRALCILFLPFRNEMTEIHSQEVTDLYFRFEDIIEKKRGKFEKHKKIAELVADLDKNEVKISEDIEEDEEREENYILEETTEEEEVERFIKEAKANAQKSLSNKKNLDERMTKEEYLEKINSLNGEQRRIFNDFVERLTDPSDQNPFHLYIGGEAGTGKSYLLRLMKEAVNRLPRSSGDTLDKPICLTMAPTGVAAYLIQGRTIESCLGIMPNSRRSFQTGNKSRSSSLRFEYEDVRVIFIDEVSMVGADKLNTINLRLQDILENDLFMGGISIVCLGDFGQLPPVGQAMIWEQSFMDGRTALAPNLWDLNFKIYYLTQKMRSTDAEYSNVCDQVRKGNITPEISEYLQKCVKPCPDEDNLRKYQQGKFSIIVTNNRDRNRINHEKLEKLLPNKPSVVISSSDKSTNVLNPPKVRKSLALTQTGQLESEVVFKEGAPIMVTSNSQDLKYKKNGIVNGVRGYIDSFQYSKENPSFLEYIWVRFNDDKIGQLLRLENLHLLNLHKPFDPLSVPFKRQKKTFRLNERGNTQYLREQFPLTLAFAVTAHKSQGQTLEMVLVDFTNPGRIQNGLFYTAISRVKNGGSLYLRSFEEEFIKCNENVEKKMESMQVFAPYEMKKIYLDEEIFGEENPEIKLGYINTRNISKGKSFKFLNNDQNLLSLDILVVADTCLDKSTSDEKLKEKLSNWEFRVRIDARDSDPHDKRQHMGFLVLLSKSSPLKLKSSDFESSSKSDKSGVNVQILRVKLLSWTAAFVYINHSPNETELSQLTDAFKNCHIVMGDLNLDPNREQRKLEKLCGDKKVRVLNEVTTDQINQLDHVLMEKEILQTRDCYSTSYINFTSDHKTITVRIPTSNGTKFSEEFKGRLNLDPLKRTDLGLKRRNPNLESEREAGVTPKKMSKTIESGKTRSLKRKSSSKDEDNVRPAKTSGDLLSFRRFKNSNSQTCWLNASLQLILTAFDTTPDLATEGSDFWKELLKLRTQSSTLNPKLIKQMLLNQEIMRILTEDVSGPARLFQFENTTTINVEELHQLRDQECPGQQDSRDFFTCLEQNKESWLDVYKLFNFTTFHSTTCLHCSYKSRPENPVSECLLNLGSPVSGKTFSQMLHERLSKEEENRDWRCDVCREVGANVRNTLADVSEVSFITVILSRLQTRDGQLHLDTTKVSIGEPIRIRDDKSIRAQFSPIAVIEHHGQVVAGQDTRGHFTADILSNTGGWLRTSDDSVPLQLREPTDRGYICLFKKDF